MPELDKEALKRAEKLQKDKISEIEKKPGFFERLRKFFSDIFDSIKATIATFFRKNRENLQESRYIQEANGEMSNLEEAATKGYERIEEGRNEPSKQEEIIPKISKEVEEQPISTPKLNKENLTDDIVVENGDFEPDKENLPKNDVAEPQNYFITDYTIDLNETPEEGTRYIITNDNIIEIAIGNPEEGSPLTFSIDNEIVYTDSEVKAITPDLEQALDILNNKVKDQPVRIIDFDSGKVPKIGDYDTMIEIPSVTNEFIEQNLAEAVFLNEGQLVVAIKMDDAGIFAFVNIDEKGCITNYREFNDNDREVGESFEDVFSKLKETEGISGQEAMEKFYSNEKINRLPDFFRVLAFKNSDIWMKIFETDKTQPPKTKFNELSTPEEKVEFVNQALSETSSETGYIFDGIKLENNILSFNFESEYGSDTVKIDLENKSFNITRISFENFGVETIESYSDINLDVLEKVIRNVLDEPEQVIETER